MGGVETLVELVLVVLLAATLVYAIRLHRAIASMRGDRSALGAAVAGFDSGTRHAEASLTRLRETAEALTVQLSHAAALKDDLAFLSDRGEQLADRLDGLVRAARELGTAGTALRSGGGSMPAARAAGGPGDGPVRSQAERDLLLALRGSR